MISDWRSRAPYTSVALWIAAQHTYLRAYEINSSLYHKIDVGRGILWLNEKTNKQKFVVDLIYRESVGGSVIQATGTVEFEDGLRTEILQEDC